MLSARIELRGEELFCADTGEDRASSVKRLSKAALSRLRGWAERYDKAVRANAEEPLVSIGRDIAEFLDEGDRWLTRVLEGTGEIAFEIAVSANPEPRERVLLDIPWELLAPGGIFLADDNERLFRIARRLGRTAAPADPRYRDLALLFMAAEVEGQGVLNYEQEEAAILRATKSLPLNLNVEESGAVEFLGQRLAQDGPFDALHLSCHGEIINDKPVLALENAEGRLDLVDMAKLGEALGEEAQKPALVFLSACRTGEHGAAAAAFVQSLARSGVRNALGWDGSVHDEDAIRFAEIFYRELANGRSVAYAAAQGRRGLLRAHHDDPRRGRHWHLARAYLGPRGGGALTAAGKPARPFRREAGYREFLDQQNRRVPVATATEFVGRRRQAQRILRAFRDRAGAGVLIHGFANQGKSSLAARIANRMPRHDTVVVFEQYDALAVFDKVKAALPPRLAADFDKAWRQPVTNNPSALRDALVDMLEGPFRTTDPQARAKPILLIVDDLERMLEDPKAGEAATPVKSACVPVLTAIIAAFRDAETESRLLLTSRYTFALSDARSDDLAARLVSVSLPPMDEIQRDKQFRSVPRPATALPPDAATAETRSALEDRIKAAAGGNPGLQAILSRPLLNGEIETARRAVAAIESYLGSGEVPKEASAAAEFFERVSPEAFKTMLTADEVQQLRAATLFSVPVPCRVLAGAGTAASAAQPERAIDRLDGLGLIDLYLIPGETEEAAANPLARPLVPALNEVETKRLAASIIDPLFDCWKDSEGDVPTDRRGLEMARLALLGEASPAIMNATARAGAGFLFHGSLDAQQALDLVLQAVAALDRARAFPGLHLLRLGAECAERLGQAEIQEMLLQRGLAIEDADRRARAMLLFAWASRLIRKGMVKEAEALLKEDAFVFEQLGDVRSRAVTMGKIADILQARGQLDEALRIRREEELPVYEHLGDVRSQAVTMGWIADILRARGQIDEALRIQREEQLPVFERLGDMRERAITMGKIADILLSRGEVDEALRIRREEQLPVFERLGDARLRAITMGKIADILQDRGQLEEALRIRREEELPVYERLGDVRERAVTMGKLADILEASGLLEEALRIRREKQLPVYERLGFVRESAVAMGKIAGILEARGQLDEALQMQLDRLPIAETMNDAEIIANIKFCCAQIRLKRGDWEKSGAQTIVDELSEGFAIARRIGRADAIGVIGNLFGQVLALSSQYNHAMTVLDEAARAFEMLGQSGDLTAIRFLQAQIGAIADRKPVE